MNSLAKVDLFDNLLDHFFSPAIPTIKSSRYPPEGRDYSMETTDTHYVLTVELPGFTKENLSIEIDNSVLRLEANDGNGIKKSVSKMWNLPYDIDKDKTNAELIDGVLTLKIGRVGSKKIEVAVS